MIISHKYKFIYVAPEKTASNTIRLLLKDYADLILSFKGRFPCDSSSAVWLDLAEPHMPIQSIYYKFFKPHKKQFNSYFKFSFVRNPWDRMVSYFEFMCKRAHMHESIHYPDHVASYELYKRVSEMGFAEFLRQAQREPKFCLGFGNFCGYERFFVDRRGNNQMNFIGKVENLQEDFNAVCDKIGIPRQELIHTNKSRHKSYTKYYDDELRDIVAKAFAADIEHFGYEFGE